MLKAIKFVQGAVAAKDYLPELTHFRIENNHIRGFNGVMSLSSPIDLDLQISPKAVPFIKAIQTCKDTIQLHLTPTGKLSIRSGKFKAFIDCLPELFPDIQPTGQEVHLPVGILKILKKLLPFIAEDASRPWARGILFRGQSAFATNNVVLVEHWLGGSFPIEINIPRSAVVELIRINEEPEYLQVAEDSCTFHFKGNRWLRTATCSIAWPEAVSQLLSTNLTPIKVPEGLWSAIEGIMPFTDDLGRVFMAPGIVTTNLSESEGASMEVAGLTHPACFHGKYLLLLKGIAETISFEQAPNPCPFYGKDLRGIIVGMRQ